MMDLSIVYSKTAKGLRARASLIGGLSSHLMKVLTHVDGTSKIESILIKYDGITEQGLAAAITQLEAEGYIKPAPPVSNDNDWAPTTNFTPMVVEEMDSVEEAEAKAKEEARIAAEHKLKAEQEARELKAQADVEKVRTKAEAKVKAQLEAERIAHEAAEAKQKAEADAKAKAEQQARQQAELKARQEAEKARLKAEAEQKAEMERKEQERLETARIAREADEAKQKAAAEAAAKAEQVARVEAERQAKAEEARQKAALKAQKELEIAEAKAKAEAEAKAQAEKEQAQREAERKAREAEVAKQKTEVEALAKAEESARLEAERQAKAEEKARLKAEAEQKAKAKEAEKEQGRLEIARIVREAEEARKKSAAKAKEERQESKRKAKASQEITAKTEPSQVLAVKVETTQAPDQDQAVQNPDVDAAPELMMQDLVVDSAVDSTSDDTVELTESETENSAETEAARVEEQRKSKADKEMLLKAERKAQAEAALIRAKVEAEERAKAEAKEIARLEMERISREADTMRKKQETEPSVNADESADGEEKSRSWEEIEEEEERIFREEEAKEANTAAVVKDEKIVEVIKKITLEETERQGREDIKRQARLEAAAISKTQARTALEILKVGKWLPVAKKAVLVYLPLLLLLLIGALHFINLGMLISPIEKLAAESIGEPVRVEKVRASLWPQPHLVLENMAISHADSKTEGINLEALKIEAVHVGLDISTVFKPVKVLKSLEFEGLTIHQDNSAQLLQWLNNLGQAKRLSVQKIELTEIIFQLRDLELPPFSGKIDLNQSNALKNIVLNSADDHLSVQLSPQGNAYDIALTADNWPLPINSKVILSKLKANGTLSKGRMDFSQIDGLMYGGNIAAKAVIDWSNDWSVSGSFNLSKAALPLLLSNFGSSASIDGKFDMKGSFAGKSTEAAKLLDAPALTASFDVYEGKINGIDLTRAVLFSGKQSLAGEPTYFDRLSGNVQLSNGRYEYTQLVLKSDQFQARGNVDIQANQDVSGKISADLAAQSRRLQTRFNLTGKLDALQKQ